MSVIKKGNVYWNDYYVNGYRKPIGLDGRLAETTQSKRYVEN
jgi:hypothetical protein